LACDAKEVAADQWGQSKILMSWRCISETIPYITGVSNIIYAQGICSVLTRALSAMYKNRNHDMYGCKLIATPAMKPPAFIDFLFLIVDGRKYGHCVITTGDDFDCPWSGSTRIHGYRKFYCYIRYTAWDINQYYTLAGDDLVSIDLDALDNVEDPDDIDTDHVPTV
jgi:hypothetical protein